MLIFCDKNEKLISELKEIKAVIDINYYCEDILNIKKKYPNAKIATASNPSFIAGGGLDKILSAKYPEEWKLAKESRFTNNLFFILSIDNNLKSNYKIIQRALALVFAYCKKKDIILTGIGTGIGGLDIMEFTHIFIEIFNSADMRDANMCGADMRGADMRGANMSGADMRGADMRGADMRDADMSGANMRDADMSGADMRGTDMRGANMCDADMCGADMRGADMRGADMSGTNMRGADMCDADMCGTNMRGTNMRGTDMCGADMRGADMRDADMSDANMSGVIGIPTSEQFISKFEKIKAGIIVYKAINNTEYDKNKKWVIKEDEIISENVNFNLNNDCGCGINFGTKEYVIEKYPTSDIWECLIEWDWLADVIVPYNTDGKARCAKLKLLKKINKK